MGGSGATDSPRISWAPRSYQTSEARESFSRKDYDCDKFSPAGFGRQDSF